MPQHLAHDLRVHAFGEEHGGADVPEVMEPYVWQPCLTGIVVPDVVSERESSQNQQILAWVSAIPGSAGSSVRAA